MTRKEYMRWDQAATALTDGNIDAFGIPNPVPSPSILQAAASAPVRVLSLPPIAYTIFSVAHADVDADVVYRGHGTFTIPLMKRSGYLPHYAAAVEATASPCSASTRRPSSRRHHR